MSKSLHKTNIQLYLHIYRYKLTAYNRHTYHKYIINLLQIHKIVPIILSNSYEEVKDTVSNMTHIFYTLYSLSIFILFVSFEHHSNLEAGWGRYSITNEKSKAQCGQVTH